MEMSVKLREDPGRTKIKKKAKKREATGGSSLSSSKIAGSVSLRKKKAENTCEDGAPIVTDTKCTVNKV